MPVQHHQPLLHKKKEEKQQEEKKKEEFYDAGAVPLALRPHKERRHRHAIHELVRGWPYIYIHELVPYH